MRIYCQGAWANYGIHHVNILEKLSQLGHQVIIGMKSHPDFEVNCIMILSCRFVDEIVRDIPMTITHAFIKKHAIDLVVDIVDRSKFITSSLEYSVPILLGKYHQLPYFEHDF
jgi:glycerol-3-phosphate cytidylyltransferase-like family protein